MDAFKERLLGTTALSGGLTALRIQAGPYDRGRPQEIGPAIYRFFRHSHELSIDSRGHVVIGAALLAHGAVVDGLADWPSRGRASR